MKILVTGGAGFIGSALSLRLQQEGHTVVIIDDFNSYYDVNLKRARVDFFLQKCHVIEGDITNKAFLKEVFSAHQFDCVCHLAAQAGVRYSVSNPSVYVDTNVRGTQNILEVMHEHGITKMVYASTSSIYGNDTVAPFKEDASGNHPVSMYAATKKAGELIAHVYSSLYLMDITCLRFFTVYGPWSRPDMAMLSFAQKIDRGEAIDIYNNGELKRDFTYIDDIVDGFVKAVETPQGYQIINLGYGNPALLMTFVELLEEKLGKKAIKNFVPMQEADVFLTSADTSKAKELLGFEAKVSFEEGVGKFVEWYRSFYAKQ
jgi:UDP-glucuronate 4-epimerase